MLFGDFARALCFWGVEGNIEGPRGGDVENGPVVGLDQEGERCGPHVVYCKLVDVCFAPYGGPKRRNLGENSLVYL